MNVRIFRHRLGVHVGLLILACMLLASLAWQRYGNPWSGFRAPDESRAAQVLLAKKLSGPRYFELEPETADMPFPFISFVRARQQLDRVAKERHLGPETKAQLEKIIDQLVEPPASRVVGEERINVLRLNMALDQIP